MIEKHHCVACDKAVEAASMGGLCAACAMKLALDGESWMAGEKSGKDFGEYELLEVLGKGGMGVVYRARQKGLNRMVALKMINISSDPSLTAKIRFRVEAEAAAKLDHPNIVPTYQIGEIDGQAFFSMRLVNGGSLAEHSEELSSPLRQKKSDVQERGSFRKTQMFHARLLSKVAGAVHYAHQHGVIHRDLKPSNILLDDDGEPYLTDFGIAKVLEQDMGLTSTNGFLGTPAYMAPEQASGQRVTASTDIYSLGAILYQLLTGHPPFKGKTPLETLRKAAEEDPVSPATVSAHVDRELAAICLKCLDKDPRRRYGSALDLAEDLERWIRREPITARRIGAFGRIVRWARRNRIGAWLIATLVFSLSGALVLLSLVSQERDKTASVLQEVERASLTNSHLLTLTVAMLHEQLDGLWLSNDRRTMTITSEQLAVLSSLPMDQIADKSSIERITFGLSANEKPVYDSRRYTGLLQHLEQRLSEMRGRPVRIDLKLFKFKEDRVEALATNGVHFARMGDAFFLRAQKIYPGIRALVVVEYEVTKKVFFTRQDTGINQLTDLKGRRVAFGDTVSGVTFWGMVKLAEAGIKGSDIAEYVCLDSRSEFMDEVAELGYEEAVRSHGPLHSAYEVIDRVVDGTYDAGVISLAGFYRHQDRGLVIIPDSEFEQTQNPWVRSPGMPDDLADDIIEVLSNLKNEPFLLIVPSRPTRFRPVTTSTYERERELIERVRQLFPEAVDQFYSKINQDEKRKDEK